MKRCIGQNYDIVNNYIKDITDGKIVFIVDLINNLQRVDFSELKTFDIEYEIRYS